MTDGFDYSQLDFPAAQIWLHIPAWEMAVKILTFVPVILFGLLANYIIIRLIVLNRSLRTPTNLIIVNMAVADFLTLLICPTMFMIDDFYQNYQLGCIGCKLDGFLEAAFLITAVLNLSVVSYDRLTAIVLPSETRLSMRGAKFLIFITWLAGFLMAMPLAIYRNYRVRQWKNFKEIVCKENPNILPKYWYVLITVLVWIPLGVMLICYTAIFIKLDRYEKRVLSRENPLTVSYKKTVARTLFIVVIVFVALRLPFTILVILSDRYIAKANDSSCFRLFWYISQYLMFFNAAINPVIYGFNNDNFRRAYEHTPLFQCFHKKNNIEAKHSRVNDLPPIEYSKQYNIYQLSSLSQSITTVTTCNKCFCQRLFCCTSSSGNKKTFGLNIINIWTTATKEKHINQQEANLGENKVTFKYTKEDEHIIEEFI